MELNDAARVAPMTQLVSEVSKNYLFDLGHTSCINKFVQRFTLRLARRAHDTVGVRSFRKNLFLIWDILFV